MKQNSKKFGMFTILLILTFGLIFAFGCEKKNPFVEGLRLSRRKLYAIHILMKGMVNPNTVRI